MVHKQGSGTLSQDSDLLHLGILLSDRPLLLHLLLRPDWQITLPSLHLQAPQSQKSCPLKGALPQVPYGSSQPGQCSAAGHAPQASSLLCCFGSVTGFRVMTHHLYTDDPTA